MFLEFNNNNLFKKKIIKPQNSKTPKIHNPKPYTNPNRSQTLPIPFQIQKYKN
jgi:hypothetical protein